MKEKFTFQQKTKLLTKLFDAGCNTEKKLQQLDMESIFAQSITTEVTRTEVENGIVYTVEGNSGDSVRVNQYPVGHYEILGYGIPQYQKRCRPSWVASLFFCTRV